MILNMIRRAAEVCLGPIVIHRRLPDESGGRRLTVSAQVGGLKYWFRRAGSWDPELLRIASLLVSPGSHVWDVGANVGLFAAAASWHAGAQGSVVAIEADIDAGRLLNRTSLAQPLGHAPITTLPVAVSEHPGFVRFAIAQRARAANAIEGHGSTQMGGVATTRVIPATSLDTLLDEFAPPSVLKIDVEGAELLALQGATRVLQQARPRIYCEVAAKNAKEAYEIFARNDYSIYDGSTFFGTNQTQKARRCYRNTVAIPKEALV